MPSERFTTMTLSGTEAVAARRHEVGDRTAVTAALRDRKLANTTTSIRLGFDQLKYESDAMARQQDILGAPPRGDVVGAQRAMKQALTATHFSLGNDACSYDTEQKSAMTDTTGRINEFKGELDGNVANFIKRSSCYFGCDEPTYTSSAHAAQSKSGQIESGANPLGMRAEAKKLKKQLGAHNFDFGNDPNRYTTEQGTGFVWDAETAKGAQGVMAKAVKDDLRQSHFALGHDDPLYETDAQRSSRCGEITTERLDQMRADGHTARTLKAELLKTNVVIGSDEKFM